MVAGGLMAIFFVCTLVCWTVWSLIYVTFAAHYFLTTLTDSSSGQDELYYPREGPLDWWWKPLMCGWVLLAWAIPATLVLGPLAAFSPLAFLIAWTLFLWFMFPLSLASMLYAQNWLVFLHRGVIGRMLRHYRAFAYVHLLTFAMFLACGYMVLRGLTDIVWLIPAIVLVPAAQLLYARHWGRFAWLSLNYLPRQTKRPRASFKAIEEAPDELPPALASEMAVEEVEAVAADAFREGPPPMSTSAIQAAAAAPQPAKEYDEWNDLGPYGVIGDPLPPYEEPIVTPPAVAAPPPAVVEEEDEWATEKKPYAYVEPAPAVAQETKAEIDTPIVLGKYYDDKAKKEAEDQRRREKEKVTMPPRSKKTPTFQAAFLGGVWRFMFYPSTLVAWGNLAVMTLVEFLLLYVLVMFLPKA